jgi:hypothetical protein
MRNLARSMPGSTGRPASPRAPTYRLTEAAGAIAIGIAFAFLVAYGDRIAPYHPLWDATLDYDYLHDHLWTATFLIATLVALPIGLSAGWLFEHRFRIAVALLIAAPALGGLNFFRLDPPDIALLVVGVFWLLSVLVENRPVLVPRMLITLLLGIGLLAVGSVAVGGPYIILSLPSIASKLGVLLLIATLIASAKDHAVALRTLAAVALISALIAILAEGIYLLTGYALTFDDRVDEHFKCFGWICVFRATGLTPTPQILGHLLMMGLAVTLFLRVSLAVKISMVSILLIGAVSTMSVGVLIAVGFVMVMYPIARWPSHGWRIAVVYALLGWLLFATGAAAWVYTMANEMLLAGSGVEARVWTYRGGAELIEKHPVFGIGALKQIPGSLHFSTPHNTYMQVALELGLPAAFLFTSMLAYLLVSCWLVARGAEDENTLRWMRALLLGMLGLLLHFMSEPMYPNNLPWTYLGLVAAGIVVHRDVLYRKRPLPVPGFTPTVVQLSRIMRRRRRS